MTPSRSSSNASFRCLPEHSPDCSRRHRLLPLAYHQVPVLHRETAPERAGELLSQRPAATLVQPGCPHVIPLQPEFIVPQDGHDKQDCELVAGKRWLAAAGPRYSALASTLLADRCSRCNPSSNWSRPRNGLHIRAQIICSQTFIRRDQGLRATPRGRGAHRTQWTGKHRLTLTYRYLNGVNLNAKPDSISVNWAALTVTDENATVTAQYAFIAVMPSPPPTSST